jgi:hypothetical protein
VPQREKEKEKEKEKNAAPQDSLRRGVNGSD